ncbi:MAG: NAD(P)/FAD-dependent oxidoreductase [Bacteroidota bacterium]
MPTKVRYPALLKKFLSCPLGMKVDYIIVGGGLAGSCLAVRLWQQQKTVALFDTPSENRATAVAAGLFNPITSQVMKRTWRANELFASLHTFYAEAEKILRARFYHPTPLYRPFVSVGEQNEWMAQSAEPGMQPFIKEIYTTSKYGHQVADPFGGLLLNHCGYVDTLALMKAVRQQAIATGSYFPDAFRQANLTINETDIVYQNLQASAIIFCEGMAAKNNPWFHWLPLHPLKGETLNIGLPETPELIYNRGVYVVPDPLKGGFKVGATYQRQGEQGVTDAGKTTLVEKLNELISMPYQVQGYDWGIRPTVPDRRPILGPHPHHKDVWVFNGLGTKGVSLAPHFSGVLANQLTGLGQIEKDVNISRFYALYSKF